MRKLAEDIEHAVLPPTMGSHLDEVVGPHVMAMLRSQAEMHDTSVSHSRRGASQPQSNGVDEAPS